MNGNISCPCGCGRTLHNSMMWILESIERELKADSKHGSTFELLIASGARCEGHNSKVGGTNNSAHLKGLAADVTAVTSRDKYLLLKEIFARGIKRMGIYKTFIHFDIGTGDEYPQEVCW